MLNTWFRSRGLSRAKLRVKVFPKLIQDWILTPYLTPEQRKSIAETGDPVRYGTVFLSLERIKNDGVPGALAECGVYKGSMSRFLHDVMPDRPLYLFDTFAGFDARDSDTAGDMRFRDASIDSVMQELPRHANVHVRKGYFPETAHGLEGEKFAFVMVDFDKYEPTLAALRFFYPRVAVGGYIYVHDYNNPESHWACARALDEFLADKTEKVISVPDAWGTALFRKT